MLPLRWRFVMGTSWAKCRIVLPMNQKWFHDFCAPLQQGHGKNVKEIYDASMKVVLFPCCTLVVKYDRCQGLSQQPVVKVEVRPSFWSELLKQCSIWMDSCLEYQQLQDFAFLLKPCEWKPVSKIMMCLVLGGIQTTWENISTNPNGYVYEIFKSFAEHIF